MAYLGDDFFQKIPKMVASLLLNCVKKWLQGECSVEFWRGVKMFPNFLRYGPRKAKKWTKMKWKWELTSSMSFHP